VGKASIIDFRYPNDLPRAYDEFQKSRKPNTGISIIIMFTMFNVCEDAIAALALQNFVEMRDLVADKDYIFAKKVQTRRCNLYTPK
jgi:hypothetical protein